jgi:small subunit ribosomal protein S6e
MFFDEIFINRFNFRSSMGIKIVIADPKENKALQRELEGDAAKFLIGLRIGDSFKGESIDLPGYEFIITGGSDDAGFPMRKGVSTVRAKILSVGGVGIKSKRKGQRIRKTVAGSLVHAHTAQINTKVVKHGSQSLFQQAETAEAKE